MPRIHSLWAAALAAYQTPAAPQPPQYIECSSITETDDIQVTNGNHNPFWDDLGHEWIVYYAIKRDSRDFAPCAMQVVMRIYNPAPDGSWSGTASVFVDVNGSYNASSWGTVSGSSAYPITLSGAVPGSGPISAPTRSKLTCTTAVPPTPRSRCNAPLLGCLGGVQP